MEISKSLASDADRAVNGSSVSLLWVGFYGSSVAAS